MAAAAGASVSSVNSKTGLAEPTRPAAFVTTVVSDFSPSAPKVLLDTVKL